jgi:hypothetical protein
MDRAADISQLKELLLQDVASLYRRDDREWSKPIVETLHQLRETSVEAVLFGGTLRSLLLSRLQSGRFGRPRDIDIVVSGASVDQLRERFQQSFRRETRFGGIQLQRMSWQFDIWPLERTWAFQSEPKLSPLFATLPSTTFFNLEAVAIDAWASRGRKRVIYSGDDQFFHGLLDKVLEVNREENPFPTLCVVRALVFASSTGFAIGPRLAAYLAKHSAVSDHELTEVQCKHYGQVRLSCEVMRRWLDTAVSHIEVNPGAPLSLPKLGQLTLWADDEPSIIHVHLLSESGKTGA